MNFHIENGALHTERCEISNFVPQILGSYTAAHPPCSNGQMLLIKVTIKSRDHYISWDASELGQLDFEREVPGCTTTNGISGKSTKRLVATYLREQLASSEMLSGAFYDKSGWQKTDQGAKFICGDVVNKSANTTAPPPYLLAEHVKHIHLADRGLNTVEATETLLQLLMEHQYTHLPVWMFTLFATLRSVLQSKP